MKVGLVFVCSCRGLAVRLGSSERGQGYYLEEIVAVVKV